MDLSDIDQNILKLWETFRDKRVRDRVLSCAEGLSLRDFTVLAVPTISEANRSIVGQVSRRSTVYFWSDPTLDELGILDTLQARGNSVKDALPLFRGSKRARALDLSDTYLTSVCAVTIDGMLVKIEPEGLPLFQPGREPGTVVVVAGVNKIVDGLEEAFRRAKDVCVPQCARRLGLELPCVGAGNCVECDSPPPMCAVQTVITRKPSKPDFLVVLIGEKLGY